MPAGRRLEQVHGFGAHRRILLLSPEVIVRAVLGVQETEACREAAATTTVPAGETPGLSELGPTPLTHRSQRPQNTFPGRGVSDGDPLTLGDNRADPSAGREGCGVC